MWALPPSEDPAGLHEPSLAAVRPTFASSASIPSRWGFPAREPEEDLTVDFAPPGFAEALFGEGDVSVQEEGPHATSDQPGSTASGPGENTRENIQLSTAMAGQMAVAWPKQPSAGSKHGKNLKILGALLAIACLGYAAYRFFPTPPWEEWHARVWAWMQSSLGAGSDFSGQNTEAAQR